MSEAQTRWNRLARSRRQSEFRPPLKSPLAVAVAAVAAVAVDVVLICFLTFVVVVAVEDEFDCEKDSLAFVLRKYVFCHRPSSTICVGRDVEDRRQLLPPSLVATLRSSHVTGSENLATWDVEEPKPLAPFASCDPRELLQSLLK